MAAVIEDVTARRLFNSRGEETLEVDVVTIAGFGRASAPAGASRGKAEVTSYPEGKIGLAMTRVEELIAPELIGRNADEQEEIDTLLHEIDGTDDFSSLGGNTAYAVSLAIAEAAASSHGIPLFQHLAGYLADELPYPLGNVLGGGRHAEGSAPDIQEFLILPIGADSFLEAATVNTLIHQKVGSLLRQRQTGFPGGKGDEGAWAPNLADMDALEIVQKACEGVTNESGVECRLGLDLAASTMWQQKTRCYRYNRSKVKRDPAEQLAFVLNLVESFNLAYVEDPFHEDDYESFSNLTGKVTDCLVSGDDLFVTNKKRLARGVAANAGNAVVIKANQVGTLSDAWETTKLARRSRYTPIISHRSGETTSPQLAHLSVAFQCPIIKTGVVGGSRVAKINELIRIEEMLGDRSKMAAL